jgi:polysaccharide pyruvyl transferase CsaB
VRVLLSGYYGYQNAGDEAVLAAITQQIGALAPGAQFVATSGAPAQTEAQFALHREYSLCAVARDDFKSLWREIKSCDVFLSGGGSLLQDVTSLRNIVYYTGLIRMAGVAKKPTMIYAQGIGPLKKPLSQKLTRIALNHKNTRVITVRDPQSKALLQKIGVRKNIEVTADPVWALEVRGERREVRADNLALRASHLAPRTWIVSLRSWLDESTPDAEGKLLAAIRAATEKEDATLQFLAMQPARDGALMESLGVQKSEILETEKLSPRAIMALAGRCDLMIAMRLHALIFAAAQGVPCVAVSYDPKVSSLAKLIGAPVVANAGETELAKLQSAALAAPPSTPVVAELQSKARRNAQLAFELAQNG